MFHTKIITGADIATYAEDIARLRIRVFREWPYLYEGSFDYEKSYFENYIRCSNSVVTLALDGATVVGASTALPLHAADDDFQAAFNNTNYCRDSIFYLGESVLLPEYRGQGAGHQFFDARESHARACGAQFTAFCAVDRLEDDPRRPKDYRTLEPFWAKRGYIQHPKIQATFDWREVGETVNSSHTLTF